MLENGLYADDWSAFGKPATEQRSRRLLWLTIMFVGAFVAAPVGGLFWGGGAFALRVGFQWIQAKKKGRRFEAFDRPSPTQSPQHGIGGGSTDEEHEGHDDPEERVAPISITPQKGRFF